jgi:uncharacterized protein (DUF2225 family)
VCPICLLETFDEFEQIEQMNQDEVVELIKSSLEIGVPMNEDSKVLHLSKCSTHFIHADCLKNMLDSSPEKLTHIRCPSCLQIHGTMTGNMPDGSMMIEYVEELKCDGY